MAMVVALLSIVLALVFQSVSGFQNATAGSEARLRNLDEARVIMAVVTRDLRTATDFCPIDVFTVPGADSNCPVGNNVALPANGVIYVRKATSGTCTGGGNRLGYPISRDDTSYECRKGDVFIRGTLKGRLTVAAENNVVIINDLVYAGGTAGNDILGLIANEYVEIYHPVDGNSNLSDSRNPHPLFTNPTIHAAILALNHSFRVQNHGDGDDLGELSITGAIAQQWRGTVGTGGATSINSGYEKNYVWDPQLAYDSPPHAFDDLDTAFQPKLRAEAKAPPPCATTTPPNTQPCLPA